MKITRADSENRPLGESCEGRRRKTGGRRRFSWLKLTPSSSLLTRAQNVTSAAGEKLLGISDDDDATGTRKNSPKCAFNAFAAKDYLPHEITVNSRLIRVRFQNKELLRWKRKIPQTSYIGMQWSALWEIHSFVDSQISARSVDT